MTWDPNKPANNESPALAPQQIRTNWARLQAMIAADHLFSAAISADQGYHRVVHWVTQGSDPAFINGTGQLYTKNAVVRQNGVDQTAAHLFHRSSDGTTQITSPITPAPCRAFVNFVGTGSNGSKTRRSAYNVSDVQKYATGRYEIVFETAMPTNTYAVFATGRRESSTAHVWGAVATDVVYADAVKTTSVFIDFVSSSSPNYHNVDMGNVIIFGG